jgi:hypothetical protein
MDSDALDDTPRRVQLSRAKGWRMPDWTVKVDRSSRWGNPFRVGDRITCADGTIAVCFSAAEAVQAYRDLMLHPISSKIRADIRANLRGKNLACWCKPSEPCHADVLLELANK